MKTGANTDIKITRRLCLSMTSQGVKHQTNPCFARGWYVLTSGNETESIMRKTTKAKRRFKNRMSNGTRYRCVDCNRVRVFASGTRIYDKCFCGGDYERFTSKMRKAERDKHDKQQYFVYAIGDGTAVKIGISKEPESRVQELQTANSRPLRILAVKPLAIGRQAALDAERQLHNKLRSFNIRGEWFREQVLQAKEWCQIE